MWVRIIMQKSLGRRMEVMYSWELYYIDVIIFIIILCKTYLIESISVFGVLCRTKRVTIHRQNDLACITNQLG